jgi:hypothetical protein
LLSKRIEELREALIKEVEKGNLHTELVLQLSQELDALIVEYMKNSEQEQTRTA